MFGIFLNSYGFVYYFGPKTEIETLFLNSNETSMNHYIKILILLICPVFTIISCQSNTLYLAESLSKEGVEILNEQNAETKDLTFGENRNILGKTVAIFYYASDPGVPADIAKNLKSTLLKKIEAAHFFSQVMPGVEKLSRRGDNRILNQKLDTYLESLAVVSVSNKDISNPLGRYLACDDFLVLQIDRWPCEICSNKTTMRMKLRLVNAKTGLIYWTSIGSISDIDFENLEVPTSLALLLSNSLIENFIHSFKRKWHKLRFHNLAMR